MPHNSSKTPTRFDVPLELQSLKDMTVLDYLSQFVWIRCERKRLYNRVFSKYLNRGGDCEDNVKFDSRCNFYEMDDGIPSPFAKHIVGTISMEDLPQSLQDTLGFEPHASYYSELLRLLEHNELKFEQLNFRTWCGVVSFAERLACGDLLEKGRCNAMEKVDFKVMAQLLGDLQGPFRLREVFEVIRRAHNVPSK